LGCQIGETGGDIVAKIDRWPLEQRPELRNRRDVRCRLAALVDRSADSADCGPLFGRFLLVELCKYRREVDPGGPGPRGSTASPHSPSIVSCIGDGL